MRCRWKAKVQEGRHLYLPDVVAEDGRIHLKRLVRIKQYMYQDQDTIVCNQKVDDGELKGIGYFASQDRGRYIMYRLTFRI